MLFHIGFEVSPWFADFSGGGLRVCLVPTLSPKEFPCLSNIFWNEMLAEFTPPELYEVGNPPKKILGSLKCSCWGSYANLMGRSRR